MLKLRKPRKLLCLLLVLCFCFTLTGCGGCTQTPKTAAQKKKEAEEKKKADAKKKKSKAAPKKELVIAPLRSQPSDETNKLALKRGHWSSVTERMKANLADFVGGLELRPVTKKGQPIPIASTPFRLRTERPIALSKGRQKTIESIFYTPPETSDIGISRRILNRSGGLKEMLPRHILKPMPAFQYHLVVLAKDPKRYTYLKTLDIVSVPNGGEHPQYFGDEFPSSDSSDAHYRVLLPDTKKSVPLPDNPLAWTTIAYVLWDGIQPESLSLEQRTAMVDWLHWGGQLIVSGPESLSLLKGSFLEPWLPVEDAGAATLERDDLASFNRFWIPRSRKRNLLLLKVTKPWSGVSFQKKKSGTVAPNSGGLLVESRVGRGRIVVSSFRLNEPDFINWKAVGGYYNACLLRRPARKWYEGSELNEGLVWADEKSRRYDPALISQVRFFTRDAGTPSNFTRDSPQNTNTNNSNNMLWNNSFDEIDEPSWRAPNNAIGGVGAWNDRSKTSLEAQQALKKAAGVKVPKSTFVLKILSLYLLVLVPINWAFFKALGRVEWAWIAAPFIAIAGTAVVIWQANLDIGFVRARTEIAVLELQGNSSRGHLTRYTAVYTSLGTTYDFELESQTALALPFPSKNEFQLLQGQNVTDVVFQKHDHVRLTGLNVISNSTTMVHSEQMLDLKGSFRVGTDSLNHQVLTNKSEWDMYDTLVVRRSTSSKKLEGCWIGRLKRGDSFPIAYSKSISHAFFKKKRNEAANLRSLDNFPLDSLLKLALNINDFEPGEVRMLGRIDTILPGMKIIPSASQNRGVTIVLAHLNYGPFSTPQVDTNARPTLGKPERSENDEFEF